MNTVWILLFAVLLPSGDYQTAHMGKEKAVIYPNAMACQTDGNVMLEKSKKAVLWAEYRCWEVPVPPSVEQDQPSTPLLKI